MGGGREVDVKGVIPMRVSEAKSRWTVLRLADVFRLFFALFLVLLPLLSPAPISAQDSDEAYRIAVARGITALNQKQYKEAEQILRSAQALQPDNPEAPLHLGRAYQAMRKDEEAAALFLRAALLAEGTDPPLATNARYHAGLSYFRLGLFDEAGSEFEKVVAADAASPVGRSAGEHLDRIKKRENGTSRFTLLSNIGYQHDDNVVLEPRGSAPEAGISRKGDHRMMFYLRGRYTIDGWVPSGTSVGYSIYQSIHTVLDKFNTQSHELSLSLPFPKRWPGGALNYALDLSSVDHDTYFFGHSLKSQLALARRTNWATQLNYQFQWKDFYRTDLFPNNSERDGTNHAIGITGRLGLPVGRFRAEYFADVEDTRGADWDYVGHRFFTGAEVPMRFNLLGDIGFDYTYRAHRNPNSVSATQERRRDRIYTVWTGIAFPPMIKGVNLSVRYTHTRHGSNLSSFDYRRGVTSVNLIGRF